MKMTTEEFNELLKRLMAGQPVGMIVNRLAMALWGVIENGGEAAEECFRGFVECAESDS